MARSRVLNFFLVLNALLLISCVSVIGVLYTKLDSKMGKLESFYAEIQENPGAFSEMIVKWVDAVAGESLLGVSDGEMSHFLANEFAINASKLSREVSDMSSFLMTRFNQNSRNCTPVGTPIKCGDKTGFVECPGNFSNPRTFYCQPGEEFVCGGDDSCVAPSIHTVAAAAEGGARLLRNWRTVGNKFNTPAAFSATVFRLDLLTEWLGAQMNPSDWKSAAQACVEAANQAKNTDWRGTYFHKDKLKTWEANREIRSVANYILQVCQPMAASS